MTVKIWGVLRCFVVLIYSDIFVSGTEHRDQQKVACLFPSTNVLDLEMLMFHLDKAGSRPTFGGEWVKR